MRNNLCVLLSCSLLFLSVLTILCIPEVYAWTTVQAITLTDKNGRSEEITDPKFNYSREHYCDDVFPHTQFEIVQGSVPEESLFVNFTQIKSADFENGVSITLDNGTVLNGKFTDPKMKITGKGSLGEVTLEIGDVKKIEFNKFKQGLINEKIVDRKNASNKWQKGRKIRSRWLISDGDKQYEGNNLKLRNMFNTNYRGSSLRLIYSTNTLRSHKIEDFLTVKKGLSKIKVPFNEMKSLEFTGEKQDNNLAVNIMKKDGKQFKEMILLAALRKHGEKGEDSWEYGQLNTYDMLVWDEPFGMRGISLVPLRKITATQKDVRKTSK